MYTNNPRRSRFFRLWLYVFMLMLAAILIVIGNDADASTVAPQPAQVMATPVPSATTPDRPLLDPFPPTDTMTDTVREVLIAYEAANARGMEGFGPVEVAWPFGYRVFMPSIHNQPRPPATATATPPPTATPAAPPTITPTPPPTATPIPADPADMAVTLWPAPSIHVARGGTLSYEIRLKNYGAGRAGGAQVRLPYDSQQMTLVDSRFTKAGDWVSEVTGSRVTVSFGTFAPGEYRTATVVFRVAGWFPDNTVINMRALYTWSDDRDGGAWESNWAPLLARGADASAPWVWLRVDPIEGYRGSWHRFFTDRFIPGEGIHTWLNTPSGVRPLTLRGVADRQGRVWLDYQTWDLQPGTYSMVLFGARSNLTAVVTFYVR